MNGAELTIAKRNLARLYREFDALTAIVNDSNARLDEIAGEIEKARLKILVIECEREIRPPAALRMAIE